jgi:hypothetical protein
MTLPEFKTMGHLSLEFLQFSTGVFRAFSTEVDALLSRAPGHLAVFFAVEGSLLRPTPVACEFFGRKLEAL